ncbi:MAG: DUF120 domain-containing protein [Candidatus Altiarchaeota archaeon]
MNINVDSDILLLLELSTLMNSSDATLHIGTGELGEKMGLSQQSASRLLNGLEDKGYIIKNRKGSGQEIRLTIKGKKRLISLNKSLSNFLSKKGPLKKFEGVLVSGLGEGAYYVNEYSHLLEEKLGYTPYPGTLNVSLEEEPENLESFVSEAIPPFEKHHRTFGELKIIPVNIKVKEDQASCHWIIPERTHHHPNEAEIIHEKNLRKKLKLKEGDKIEIILSE